MPTYSLLNITEFCHTATFPLNYSKFRHLKQALYAVLDSDEPAISFGVAYGDFNMPKNTFSKEFASVSLNKTDADKFTKWVNNLGITGVEACHRMLSYGYKVSMTWVDSNNAFCVSLIGTDATIGNRDKIMTSWSDDLEEALLLSAYKHIEMCGEGEWPTQVDNTRWG